MPDNLEPRLRELENQHAVQTVILKNIEEKVINLTEAIREETLIRQAEDAKAKEEAWKLKLRVYGISIALAMGSGGAMSYLFKFLG